MFLIASEDNPNGLTKSPALAVEDLNDNLLLDNFGPSTFASANEIIADEENDAKIWSDVIQSIKNWQMNKLMHDKRKISR